MSGSLRFFAMRVVVVTVALVFFSVTCDAAVIYRDNDITNMETDGTPDFPGTTIEPGGDPPTYEDDRTADGNNFGALVGPFLDQDPNRGLAAIFRADVADLDAGLLEVGNALRFSIWMGSDPADPFIAPNVNIMKLELYRTPLEPNSNGLERTLDTDQDRLGNALLPSGQEGGTTFTEADMSDSDWTQFVYDYVIDQDDLNAAGPTDLAEVEEIRAALFVGNWGAGEGPGGTLLFDRATIEWFADEATMTGTAVDTTSPGAFPAAAISASDFNGDGAVDAADAGIMFGEWGSVPPNDPIADLNTDGFVDAADAGIMFGEWTGDLAPAASESASAEYNVETGELRMNANGVVNVFVNSDSGGITPLSADPPGVQGLLTNNKNRVGMTNLSPINLDGYSFGSIGAGLAMDDLTLVYSPRLGGTQVTVPASGEAGAQFHYIPEPTSLNLIGLALAGLLTARLKR